MRGASSGTGPRRWHVAIIAALSLLTLLPFLVTRFPPLYDYYYWMYEGHVVAKLLPWGPGGGVALPYRLVPRPVPNLAAPLGIGMLGSVMPAEEAARVFAALSALAMAAGFAYLVRSVQRRPSVVEFLGFPVVLGYLTYKGYLSNICSFGLGLFAIGKLQRVVDRGERIGWGTSASFAALGVATYLCHLLGWAPFAAAIGIHALALAWRGRRACGARLAASLVPSLALGALWVLRSPPHEATVFYDSPVEKSISLLSPLMLFLRTDPFPPPFPLVWVNVLGAASLLAVVVFNRESGRPTSSRPLALAALLLLVGAIASPLQDVGGASRPDERLLLAGLLLGLATVRCVPLTPGRALAAACVPALLLALHAVEYARAGKILAEIKSELDRLVPLDHRSVGLTLWESRTSGGCGAVRRPSIGVPTLKWFDLERFLDSDASRVHLMGTSLVRYDPAFDHAVEHATKVQSLDRIRRFPIVRETIEVFPVLEILGCRQDAEAVERELRREYDTIERFEWLTVLRGPAMKGHWVVPE